jgi:hypothetical protein
MALIGGFGGGFVPRMSTSTIVAASRIKGGDVRNNENKDKEPPKKNWFQRLIDKLFKK